MISNEIIIYFDISTEKLRKISTFYYGRNEETKKYDLIFKPKILIEKSLTWILSEAPDNQKVSFYDEISFLATSEEKK